MTKKHLQFCIYYMQVGDPQVAYKMTYPRAAVKSLKASVSRLMARPDVAEWVKGTEERVHHRMMRQFYSEHYDQLKEKLLTINEKRTVLTRIITGETKRIRYVQAKYGVQKIEEDQPVYAVLRAIDLDTRLENFYNYLTRSDTWRKAQNIYVNTPTLQQQVNILISQTAEQEEPKDTQQQSFPLGRGTEGDVLSPVTPEPITASPRNLSRPGREGDRGTLAPDTPQPEKDSPPVFRRGDWQNVSGVAPIGEVNSRRILAPKKIITKLTTEPVSSLTPKKIINKLTTVNKPLTIPCQSTTYKPPIFPTVKPHHLPPDL